MALKFTSDLDPENIYVGMDPSVSSGLVHLDEDMNGVMKVADKDGQKFVVDTFDGNYWSRTSFDLSGLTCETE